MMNYTRMLINRMPWQRLLALCMILIFVTAISACRDKSNNIVGPNPHPTGSWAIYLSHDGVHIGSLNDTISVRVYSPEGVLTGNVTVHSVNKASANLHVSGTVVTTADTVSFPWGTSTTMVYWGADTTVEADTITSTAFVNGIEVADTFTIISLIGDF
jgi:hypothetical protein